MGYETVTYEERDRVAWVTLNRPEVLNAFNSTMLREIRDVWLRLRENADVNAVVLTGAGEKAFCTGIDREEALGGARSSSEVPVGSPAGNPFMFDDPGAWLGPKANDLWKPVIAAVRGMACGGAFYLLGEVDVIIASADATFFDPHVTYGMASSFESMHMLQRMPLGEVIRMQLLGSYERVSAKRAYEIGLVSEVVASDKLLEAAAWIAETIAKQPPLAVQGTLRAIWAAQELSRSNALQLGSAFVNLGNTEESLQQGQEAFSKGERPKWRLR